MRFRDSGWKKLDPGSGMEKIRIRDKHFIIHCQHVKKFESIVVTNTSQEVPG
jgi:hypothetical protein